MGWYCDGCSARLDGEDGVGVTVYGTGRQTVYCSSPSPVDEYGDIDPEDWDINDTGDMDVDMDNWDEVECPECGATASSVSRLATERDEDEGEGEWADVAEYASPEIRADPYGTVGHVNVGGGVPCADDCTHPFCVRANRKQGRTPPKPATSEADEILALLV